MSDWRLVDGRLLWHTADLAVAIDALGGPSAAAPAHLPRLAEALPGVSPFVLWEWTPYRITVSPPRPGLGIRYGDAWAQDLGQGVYLLRFENNLGATVLRFRGAPVPPLAVEVLTRKLGDAADPVSHVALYRRLVADVLAALITLPFAVSGATGHTTEREGAPAGPLFTLHFFLRHGRALAAALQAIDYAPHRVLTREELLQPVARARSVPAGALRAALTRSHDWAERSGDQPGWFRRDGRSYLPFRMYLERSEETFDTPENRFVKHFLRLLLRSMEQVLELATTVRLTDGELHRELRCIAHTLQEAAAWPWLAEVGEMSLMPAATQVLHRKSGYRELYLLYPEYLHGRRVFGNRLDRSIAARDVATLYEYWCFLHLVRLLGSPDLLGPAGLVLELNKSGDLQRGLSARFADATLSFNRSFRGGGGSYSLGLRPDFTLLRAGRPELVFDAKFRLTSVPGDISDPGAAASYPQAGDIYKMHTYRDALGVRAAVALYPGDVAVFFDKSRGGPRPGVTLREILLHCDLEGVGAIPLRPEGGPPAELERLQRLGLDHYLIIPDTARYIEPTHQMRMVGCTVYLKAFSERFQPFERIMFWPVQGPWGVALRIALRPEPNDCHSIEGIDAGLLYYKTGALPAAQARGYAEALTARLGRETAIFDRSETSALPMVGERFLPGEWPGTEPELQDRIGQVLLAATAVLRGAYSDAAEADLAEALTEHISRRGYYFTPEQIATFYGALKAKGFVLLSGLSGTGKTRLAQEFVEALGLDPDRHFLLEPVRPDWRDSSGLLGYWNPVSAQYEGTRFLRLLLAASGEYREHGATPAVPPAAGDGLAAFVRRSLEVEWVSSWLNRYQATLKRFANRRSGWTDSELDLLWRDNENNGITPIQQAARPVVGYDVLRTATDMLADRNVPVAERALRTLLYLMQEGEPIRQRARVNRVLAVLDPELVPGVVGREDILRAGAGLGLSLRIRRRDHLRWPDFAVAWQAVQDAVKGLLAEIGRDAGDPALRGVVTWLAREYAVQGRAATGQEEPKQQGATAAMPFFVVLDEMNLARVEYYLADVLSVLETGRIAEGPDAGFTRGEISLHNRGTGVLLPDGTELPEKLRLPPNLYIVGTVNMDETTFAFSPKVLDRAFTLEFREIDLAAYPPVPDPGAPVTLDQEGLLEDFRRDGNFTWVDRGDLAEWATDRRGLIDDLQRLYTALFDHDLHFGYRVVDEILAFVGALAESPVAGGLQESDAFDAAVMMKVLPKFHGPLHRMEAPLQAVLDWAGPPDGPRFPRVYRKVQRMLQRAIETGHTSFS